MKREHALKIKEMMHKASSSLSDTDALEAVELFKRWNGDGQEYVADERVSDDGILYKVLQDHTSQPSWKPADSPSLFVRVDDPSIEWPEWVQPLGSTDAYPFGAKVSHNGKHWISDVDGNVWEPGVYGWTEATE
mgnify:CR=1 FL=1